MNYYVFRINYEEWYKQIREEILKGRLRQGWGAEGMNINQSFEEYLKVWIARWGENDATEKYIRNKYNNISIMREINVGDVLIVPKLNFNDVNDRRSFAVLKCSKKYEFSPLGSCGMDFGHVLEFDMKESFCCSYDFDGDTRSVVKLFRAYQRSVNRVWNTDFKNSVDKLIEKFRRDPNSIRGENMTTIGALCAKTASVKQEFLNKIIKEINSWKPNDLEKITEELFVKNGYEKICNNRYDRKGGDIDIVFSSFQTDTLIGDIFAVSKNVEMPEIRVQLKNKEGIDDNDIEGIEQLASMDGSEESINILINTTIEYSERAKETAAEKGIILINGIEFAELLLRYGMVGFDY